MCLGFCFHQTVFNMANCLPDMDKSIEQLINILKRLNIGALKFDNDFTQIYSAFTTCSEFVRSYMDVSPSCGDLTAHNKPHRLLLPLSCFTVFMLRRNYRWVDFFLFFYSLHFMAIGFIGFYLEEPGSTGHVSFSICFTIMQHFVLVY